MAITPISKFIMPSNIATRISTTPILSDEAKLKFSNLFMTLYYKYRSTSCVKNRSKILLGIDVLRDEKKKEILQLVALIVESKLLVQLTKNEIYFDHEKFLAEVIQTSFERFILRNYGIALKYPIDLLYNSLFVTNVLKESKLMVLVPFYSVKENNSIFFNRLLLLFTP